MRRAAADFRAAERPENRGIVKAPKKSVGLFRQPEMTEHLLRHFLQFPTYFLSEGHEKEILQYVIPFCIIRQNNEGRGCDMLYLAHEKHEAAVSSFSYFSIF
ncbi:MAG: hypothetical protein SOY89_04175 [Dysosmobacter sp.]|nr:hypothetical protein [Dysosmobacter sp.]